MNRRGLRKGEEHTRGAALSPWRHGEEREGVHHTGGVEFSRGPRWQETSHAVAEQTRRITTDFEGGSARRQSVLQLPS